ncbi:hypothetical protein [Nostoc sp.]
MPILRNSMTLGAIAPDTNQRCVGVAHRRYCFLSQLVSEPSV